MRKSMNKKTSPKQPAKSPTKQTSKSPRNKSGASLPVQSAQSGPHGSLKALAGPSSKGTGDASSEEDLDEGEHLKDEVWVHTSFPTVRQAILEGEKYSELVYKAVKDNTIRLRSGLRSGLHLTGLGGARNIFGDLCKPFPTLDNCKYAHGQGYSYIEVAARMRLLFAVLFHFANNEADLRDGKTNRKPSTYLDGFSKYLGECRDKWSEAIFPTQHLQILKINQEEIDAKVRQLGSKNDPFTVDARSIAAKLELPHFSGKLNMGTETSKKPVSIGPVPIGLVSLEVAFILSLQLAGIDLAAMSQSRKPSVIDGTLVAVDKITPPPHIWTCASFSEGDDVGYNEDIIHAITKDEEGAVHTTVRTLKKKTAYAAGTGVYVGFNLKGGLDISKAQSLENRTFFCFAFHPVDPDVLEPKNLLPKKGPRQKQEPNTKSKVTSKSGSEAKLVWPHCHQGFFERGEFQRMFVPNTDSRFTTNDLQMPQYDQVLKSHIYLDKDPEMPTGTSIFMAKL